MITAKQLTDGAMLFVEKEMLPAVDGWRAWLAEAALVLFYKRAGTLVEALAENKLVSALGLIDAEGNIDIDAAVEAAKNAIQKRGKLSVDIPGLDIVFNFTEKDVDALHGYIMRAAGNVR